MLSNKQRFHGHGSLRFVYSKGQVARSKYFICKSTTNARRTDSRVAVVVSKKVMKSAVRRNRMRRRLYEVIRHQLALVGQPSDIVFIVTSPEILLMPASEMNDAVAKSLTRLSNS